MDVQLSRNRKSEGPNNNNEQWWCMRTSKTGQSLFLKLSSVESHYGIFRYSRRWNTAVQVFGFGISRYSRISNAGMKNTGTVSVFFRYSGQSRQLHVCTACTRVYKFCPCYNSRYYASTTRCAGCWVLLWAVVGCRPQVLFVLLRMYHEWHQLWILFLTLLEAQSRFGAKFT